MEYAAVNRKSVQDAREDVLSQKRNKPSSSLLSWTFGIFAILRSETGGVGEQDP